MTFSKSNAYLSTAADSHAYNIRLFSMTDSVINLLRPKRHATLQVKDLSNCLIFASSFTGAAHLTNLHNCVVVLICHQVLPLIVANVHNSFECTIHEIHQFIYHVLHVQ